MSTCEHKATAGATAHVMDADVSFHESTITSFFKEKHVVHISLEGVTTRDGRAVADVTVVGVNEVLIDGERSDILQMDFDDGEVLTLDVGPAHIDLVVVWNDVASRDARTRCYRIEGRDVAVSVDGC